MYSRREFLKQVMAYSTVTGAGLCGLSVGCNQNRDPQKKTTLPARSSCDVEILAGIPSFNVHVIYDTHLNSPKLLCAAGLRNGIYSPIISRIQRYRLLKELAETGLSKIYSEGILSGASLRDRYKPSEIDQILEQYQTLVKANTVVQKTNNPLAEEQALAQMIMSGIRVDLLLLPKRVLITGFEDPKTLKIAKQIVDDLANKKYVDLVERENYDLYVDRLRSFEAARKVLREHEAYQAEGKPSTTAICIGIGHKDSLEKRIRGWWQQDPSNRPTIYFHDTASCQDRVALKQDHLRHVLAHVILDSLKNP